MSTSPVAEGDLQPLVEIETHFLSARAVDKGQRHTGVNVNVTCGAKDDIQIWDAGYNARAKHLEEYRSHSPLSNGTCEVLVLCAGRVVAIDLSDSPETFAAPWGRLAQACFFDAPRWPVGPSSPIAEPVETFPRSLGGQTPSRAAIRLSDELQINSTNLIGAAQIYDSRLCHLPAFADAP